MATQRSSSEMSKPGSKALSRDGSLQPRTWPVVPKPLVKRQVAVPRNATKDHSLLAFRAIGQRIGPEHFRRGPLVLIGQNCGNHDLRINKDAPARKTAVSGKLTRAGFDTECQIFECN